MKYCLKINYFWYTFKLDFIKEKLTNKDYHFKHIIIK